MTAFVGNTNLLTLEGLKDHITGSYINDASVEVTVKDKNGTAVTGQTWPEPMDYVPGSNGNYRAVIEHDVAFTAKQKYYAHIDANAGAERIGHWEFEFKPLKRTGVTDDT